MRTIDARAEPSEYAEWRAAAQTDINYGYDLIPGELKGRLKAALIAEQRGICAYTGIGLEASRSHIEHIVPQAHCVKGEGDVAYNNMVACFPGSEDRYVPFGALYKASWPPPGEMHLFVTPRSIGCENRFNFDLRGKITANDNDESATVTIKRLGLDNPRLTGLRQEAINATLKWHGHQQPLLDVTAARRRLARLEQVENENGQLEPFCFALKQALRKHIQRLESIRASRRRTSR